MTGALRVWVAVLALLLAGCGASAEPPASQTPEEEGVVTLEPAQVRNASVETLVAHRVQAPPIVKVPGTVGSPDTARVSAGAFVEGRVEQVLVLEGDEVGEGAPLVAIHSHELADWARELTAAEARVDFGAAALERSRRLLADGAVSREEVERRELELRVAEADLARAREIVGHLSPENGRVVIRSPRAGTVFRVLASPGEAVLPGTALVELGGTRSLWATGAAPERAAVEAERGDAVVVSFPGLGRIETTATVMSLGVRVDPELRSVPVRVQLDSVPPGVRVGSLATLHLPAGGTREGVRLPADAIQRLDGGDYVFVQEGEGRYRAHPVEILFRQGEDALVDGVEEGTEVVARGAYTLRAVLEGFQGPEDDE